MRDESPRYVHRRSFGIDCFDSKYRDDERAALSRHRRSLFIVDVRRKGQRHASPIGLDRDILTKNPLSSLDLHAIPRANLFHTFTYLLLAFAYLARVSRGHRGKFLHACSANLYPTQSYIYTCFALVRFIIDSRTCVAYKTHRARGGSTSGGG